MRAVELAKVAAAAEALRLRRMARRQAMRMALAAGAALFALAAFALPNVAAVTALVGRFSPLVAILIVMAVDLVIAIVLAWCAVRSTPGAIEAEALLIRQRALGEARASMTMMAMFAEIASVALRRAARDGLAAGIGHGLMRMFRG